MKTDTSFRKVAYYEPVKCPVCGLDVCEKRYMVAERVLVCCTNCLHEYVNPAPIFASSNNYEFPAPTADALATEIDSTYLTGILKKYHLSHGRMLDLGCGQGRLAHGFLKAGWEPGQLYLLDYHRPSLDIAAHLFPEVHIIHHDISHPLGFDAYFDCIVMEEFFEHLIYPGPVMQKTLAALKPGGVVIIRGIPNNHSLEAYIAKEKWKMRASVTHYSFFNSLTFVRFARLFPEIEILEYGAFLQPGYSFYHPQRIAKDLGLLPEPRPDSPHPTIESLIATVVETLKNSQLESYPLFHRLNLPPLDTLLQADGLQVFFDRIHLDFGLSPDFSVVIRKRVNFGQ